MIVHNKSGGRTIELFIPFDYNGKTITSITIAPLRLGHVIRWGEGAWKTMIGLLVDLAGVDEAVIRELRYPDADRVMDAFMGLLTPEIRDDIVNNRIPQPLPEFDPLDPAHTERVTNGSGAPVEEEHQMIAPGVPIPTAGFDLTEEP